MLRCPSPAKLNLFLHITGRREDGYHMLQTAFQLLDYGDELSFKLRNDKKIALTEQIDGVSLQDNLVWRAATALRELALSQGNKRICGVDIAIKKNLPLGAGLGGGSSNAATTLLALNSIWNCNFERSTLADLGVALGADVPVFVYGHSAWAEGIGEKLQPLELPERWFVVVHPAVHISTVKLFSNSELTRDCTPITIRGFRDGEPVSNVFEPIVCAQQPAVQNALEMLAKLASENCVGTDCGASGPAMTGTGSCVFLACESKQQAQNVQRELTDSMSAGEEVSVFIAKGVNHSPLNKVIETFRHCTI
ncbi:4-(cytidine 5'-diphospho)-2-C-methyl-D-erythritol kinase [Chromatiales bacterium (ex Bugula neritina AB1)]|nr:4-(cytidine 5'-diphospho)-2-C-methyl-D-erythritol kinase [Chromatiales bacterium (ex Bugula neritina AB1)]